MIHCHAFIDHEAEFVMHTWKIQRLRSYRSGITDFLIYLQFIVACVKVTPPEAEDVNDMLNKYT